MRLTLAVLLIMIALLTSVVYVKTSSVNIVQVTPLDPVDVAAYYCLGISQGLSKTYLSCVKAMLLSESLALERSVNATCSCTEVYTKVGEGEYCTGRVLISYAAFSKNVTATAYLIPLNYSVIPVSTFLDKIRLVFNTDKLPVLDALQVKTYPSTVTCICDIEHAIMNVSKHGIIVNLPCWLINTTSTLNITLIDERGLRANFTVRIS